MERIDTEHSGIEGGVCFEKLSQRAFVNVATTCQSDMRMPGAKFGFEAGGEGRFLHTLVNLEKMRMTGAHADPDNLWWTLWWKCSDTGDWQKEGAESDRVELLAQP